MILIFVSKFITMNMSNRFSLFLLFLGVILGSFQINLSAQFPDYPAVRFMVFSDPHYFDSSLGSEGKALQDYLDSDRKLLKHSRELMEVALSSIIASDADFVLVPGDLTKDGEMINHRIMAGFLAEIENAGKKVFVVPGNHDINNPSAMRYSGDRTEKVETISPSEFADNYSAFGYGEAILRDANSLSYVAEPVDGLWLLGLDACRYKENPPAGHPITSGKFSPETMVWLEQVLEDARNQNKAVLTMMHHGAVEHYQDQKKLYGEYVVDGYKKVSALLAEYGARLVFTGHFHAQDITIKRFGDNRFVIDVETGSLVTWPCPVRTVSISSEQVLKVQSDFITGIPSKPGFEEYSQKYVHDGISGIAANTLIGMKVDSTESWALSGQVADAFLAHYKGDEITPEEPFNMDGISFKGKFLIGFKKNLVKSLHSDLPPSDNILEISLK